jgi:prevent-host-death family protein
MATYNLNEAKTHLSRLVEAAQKGEEILIARYGVPVAKVVAVKKPAKRALGFYPIDFDSDLLEPTDEEILESFYK